MRASGATTLAEVARAAGVSPSTVSHVINGTRHVSETTARTVHATIDALGYRPNAVARSLARASTNAVGVVMAMSSNRYFTDIVCAVERACRELGQVVLLVDSRDDPTVELEAVRELHQRRVDGIVLAPAVDPERRTLRYLVEQRLPCVVVDRVIDAELDQVGVTNEASMRALVEYLIGLGHRRVGIVGGQPGLSTSIDRLGGYRVALEGRGIPVDESLIEPGNASADAAALAAGRLLRLDPRPSAIVAGNNLSMIGTMRAVRSAGLTVPNDLALAGFDDFEWADSFEPRLTVMAQPCEAIGRRAAALLARRIAAPDAPPRTSLLEPTLVVRSSCGSTVPATDPARGSA